MNKFFHGVFQLEPGTVWMVFHVLKPTNRGRYIIGLFNFIENNV